MSSELPPSGLVDTSIFSANESGRPLGALPDRLTVSVVTIGELQLGVLTATDAETKTRRANTLALARAADPLPISEAVMVTWARLVNGCKQAGITRTVKLTDALIAATAIEHALPVITQDEDYDAMAAVYRDLSVVRA